MKSDVQNSDECGTVLEPIPALSRPGEIAGSNGKSGTQLEPPPSDRGAKGNASPESGYRPSIRPLVPRLVVLEDGELAAGETYWLRKPVTVIGRSEGDILLPHDSLVSGKHVEISREGAARPHRWQLRDLGSANGTFVRCTRARLSPDSVVVLGSRRFHFRPSRPVSSAAGTALVDVASAQTLDWPSLVETTQTREPLQIPLRGSDLTIGRPGYRNAIEIDDPLLAGTHARVHRDHAGRWVLEALPTMNGIWVQVQAITLAPTSQFQVGEQRLLFVVTGG